MFFLQCSQLLYSQYTFYTLDAIMSHSLHNNYASSSMLFIASVRQDLGIPWTVI